MVNKKILCVIDCLGSGGAQRQLVELAIGLKKKGYHVEFLVYFNLPFFEPILKDHKIPVQIVNKINPLGRIFEIRRAVRKYKPDTVISYLETPNFICELIASPFRKWKLIVGERSADPNIYKSFKRKVFRLMHFRADFIVANSESNASLIKKINPFLSSKKIKIIYNIVNIKNIDQFLHVKSTNQPQKFNITVVASHQYLKNAKGLIEAVSILPKEKKEKIVVNWYGEQNRDASFSEAVKLIKNYKLEEVFVFHHHDSNIFEKMVQADVNALFSFYEGFPNVICEAMLLGKAVIASNVSDLPKFIKSECLFNPKSIEDIARKISFIMDCDEKQLKKIGQENREKAQFLFDSKKNISEYCKLI